MITELGWKDLADRRKDNRLSLLYKIVNDEVNIDSDDTLVPISRETRLRDDDKKFQTIFAHLDGYKYSFYPRTIKDWNQLPASTINAPSIETFKRKLKAPSRDDID